MTPEQEKYILAAHEQTLNILLNIHAESRATKELTILLAKSSLKFPAGRSADEYWQTCFDKAFGELTKQSKVAILKQLK
jgi:hypothetical protein